MGYQKKSFIKKGIFFSFKLILLLFASSYLLIKNNTAVYEYLYNYQINKIKQQILYSNLLIGDSSLGNAIDSDEFTSLSNQSTINCALTGSFGYAGSYNMLKTAHKFHPELKNVILMQTLDIQTREVSMAGYVRTSNTLDDIFELNNHEKVDFIESYVSYIQSIPLSFWKRTNNLIHSDYIKQNGTSKPKNTQEPLNYRDINPEKIKFLKKIINYCSENNINLIYIHGPLISERLEKSYKYIDKVNEVLSIDDITLIETPIGIDKANIGDSEDHVLPKFKKEYTKRYYESIKQYLIQ